jgi:hypothetical protein
MPQSRVGTRHSRGEVGFVRRKIIFTTAACGIWCLVFCGFLGAATWGQWGHTDIVIEAVGCIVSGVCCALGVAVLCADCLREAALDGVAAQVAAALVADPFLHDRVVRRLADVLADGCRTTDLRQARQTKPFEVKVRPIGVVR